MLIEFFLCARHCYQVFYSDSFLQYSEQHSAVNTIAISSLQIQNKQTQLRPGDGE